MRHTLPEVASYMRMSKRNSVDLPLPEAPTMAQEVPEGTDMETPFRTFLSPAWCTCHYSSMGQSRMAACTHTNTLEGRWQHRQLLPGPAAQQERALMWAQQGRRNGPV